MTKGARMTLRSAQSSQARRLHGIVSANQEEGHLLPRTLSEISVHADRFVVALVGRRVVGCAELAPLSPHVAEVRSLAVDARYRGRGVGAALVEDLRQRARVRGYEKLCAFTHRPRYFSQLGFSIVPHLWLTEKIYTDCASCPLFRRCGQYAMVTVLDETRERAADPATIALRPA